MPDRYAAHPVFGLCRYVPGVGFVRVDPKHYAVSDDYEANKREAARLNSLEAMSQSTYPQWVQLVPGEF